MEIMTFNIELCDTATSRLEGGGGGSGGGSGNSVAELL